MGPIRPRSRNRAAANLLFTGLGFSLLIVLLEAPDLLRRPAVLGLLLVGYLRQAAAVCFVRRGHAWAKYLVLRQSRVLARSRAYPAVFHHGLRSVGRGPWALAHDAVPHGTRTGALVLLFRTPQP
ncbi:hypothetical protein [Hymenobacter nivis]|uniref:Uncharacterized protein n=1 Tax=Hymenobacter nivis TaxID=1850093 RepID=A0A502GUI7_9BACT|nr:hypothetical protein [Hymenobacter nivis]TPG65315.1 hypothetical protein EAH73_12575 [Hymenobacter nivis]